SGIRRRGSHPYRQSHRAGALAGRGLARQTVAKIGRSGRMTRFPIVYRRRIAPEWLDADGRMAPFAFNLAFSRATDEFFALFGLTPAYRDETLCTIYTLEARTHFLADCHAGGDIHVDCRLIDLDAKRTHLLLTLYRDDTMQEASRQEALIMH